MKLLKFIDIDPKTRTQISETDIYTKQKSPIIESRLKIIYYYNSKTNYTDFLDSTATDEKMTANRAKLDSLIDVGKKNGGYLCGTAQNEILWAGIPFLPIPTEIEKDSAFTIIEHWTK